MSNDTENPNHHFDDHYREEEGDDFLDRQSSLSDVSLPDNHGSDSPPASQPEKVNNNSNVALFPFAVYSLCIT